MSAGCCLRGLIALEAVLELPDARVRLADAGLGHSAVLHQLLNDGNGLRGNVTANAGNAGVVTFTLTNTVGTATVTALNSAGSISGTTLAIIEPVKLYLPLVLRFYSV